MTKLRVAILGATGTVGQRLISLLEDHPYFEVVALAASERSTGKTFHEALGKRWKMPSPLPARLKGLQVLHVHDVAAVTELCDLAFCAVDMNKHDTQALEEAYAKAEVPVVSSTSSHRWTPDVPMVIPEVNPDHLQLIESQKKRLGTRRGFIVVKPNCSIQSYVPALAPLAVFGLKAAFVTTYQAISGSGKSLSEAPEILDNVIPLPGEEDKSEREPLRVLGSYAENAITLLDFPISAHCNRVPTEDGHYAVVSVGFHRKPSREQVLSIWNSWQPEINALHLPSAPTQTLTYLTEELRPQTRIDRDIERGMGFCLGRLRDCPVLDFRFSTLSHNTIRGAAGGAILTAELLYAKGFLRR
jgi:aspartate-semialdehyde dehydrogenase